MLYSLARRTSVALAVLCLAIATTGAASAESPVFHDRDGGHKEVTVQYFPDDICGPRAGWGTFTVTWHDVVVDRGDGWHVGHLETGTYAVDYDDPATPDLTGQFTEAVHYNMPREGLWTFTQQFHDFPGTIVIRSHIVLIEVDGTVRVDRVTDSVTGCP